MASSNEDEETLRLRKTPKEAEEKDNGPNDAGPNDAGPNGVGPNGVGPNGVGPGIDSSNMYNAHHGGSFQERKKYTTHEYAVAFRYWMWQQQWMQQMNWMAWMSMNFAAQSVCYQSIPNNTMSQPVPPQTNNVGGPQVNLPRFGIHVQPQAQAHPQPLQNQRRRGLECTIPIIWKRVAAELIDFLILFVFKLVFSLLLVEWVDTITFKEFMDKKKIDIEKYDIENIFNQKWDPQLATFTSDLIAVELLTRCCVSILEALALRKGCFGAVTGTTPGKCIMGLYVVLCEDVVALQGTRVFVTPAKDIGFWNSLVRSVVKNFSFIFFFPICLTACFFPFRRTAYDIFSNSVVIELTPQEVQAFRRHRLN